MQWFKFCLPIGWNELSAIATTIAVIIAVFANLNSNKQLKKALQMHEQSKNIAFFDRRIVLVENVKNNKSISLSEIKLLFNKEVLEAMRLYHESHNELNEIEKSRHNFWYFFDERYKFLSEKDKLKQQILATGNAVLNARKKGEVDLKAENDFKELCEENIMEWTPPLDESKKTLNYYQIFFDLQKAKEIENQRKYSLIYKMEEYILKSIQPIS